MWRENFRHDSFRPGQEQAIDTIFDHFQKGQNFVVAEIPTGCVHADTTIRVSRAKIGYQITIKDAWIAQSRVYAKSRKLRQNPSIPTMVRGLKTKKSAGLVGIEKIVHSGYKHCITLTSESGRKLTLTEDHLIYTESGWEAAANMLGKSWFVDSHKAKSSGKTSIKVVDKYIGYVRYHPNATVVKSKRDGEFKKIAEHVAIYEANLNGLSLEDFIKILKSDEEAAKSLQYVKKGNHIHHLDNDHFNNSPENLLEIPAKEHLAIHGRVNFRNFSQGYLTKEKVVKIEDVGVKEVFDVYKSETESFTANDVVVHNCGKSDIAMALAKTFGGGYVATSQNTLIDQYVKDFRKDSDFWFVKGRSNYVCPIYGDCTKGADAGCDRYKEQEDCSDDDELDDFPGCKYKSNRNRAVKAKVALTNLTYFALGINPNAENPVWNRRSLAVIDEAHNLPSEILNLTSLVITTKHLRGIMMIKSFTDFFPVGPVDMNSPKLWDFMAHLEKYIQKSLATYDTMEDATKIAFDDIMDDMMMLAARIAWFKKSYDDDVEWICDLVEEGKFQKLIMRPLESDYFAQKMFFERQADQYLLQSATIVNHKRYAKELGIDSYEYVEAESPFQLFKNRPLFCMNTGKMGNNDIKGTLPALARDVERIMNAYKGKKGLIHTVNYGTIHAHLKEAFGSDPRCLFLDKGNKAEMLEYHSKSEDTVLFSPSLTEGFDGKDDLVRFQVICKIPYAGLGDRRIKIKLERDPSWYRDEAFKTIAQMVGRGVRSEKDYCDNYILDSGFPYFCKQVSPPKSFMNTVIFSKDITDKRLSSRR
jgi:Rad3-related DNA helicase